MILIMGVVAIMLPGLSTQQCLSADDNTVSTAPGSRLELFTGEQAFSIAMLKEAVRDNPTGNVFFAPYSVYNALLLTYFGAANQTEGALQAALRIPQTQSKISTMQAYSLEKYFQDMKKFNGSESYELSSANRLFISNDRKLRDCMARLFEGEVQSIDFRSNPEAARQIINGWVETQTKRHIQDLIPQDKISVNTQLVLANAAYFKGKWQSQFLPEQTKRDLFYNSPSSKPTFVDFMKQKGAFNHIVSEKLGAHILELPYKGNDISMFIILPPFTKANGVESIIENLSLESLHELLEDDLPKNVEVVIPKFAIEQTITLKPILERLGVGDLFQSTSDLSGFTGEPNLQLDDAIHKAKISLDEQGTVAAASTAIFSFRSSRPLSPVQFIANHPFMYLIFDKTSQTIQFMGVYRTPN
ncbi:hypothetical protein L9F63_010959 [Diploptera punctata]|uniref:Serpin domain-containing protein n=1 Tax=Diploptera punctata TaxID=6984 RepID=A0AAD8AIE6_DIPPU|nr:hypothetical protein L9F63_010959 [Diploptera punctata]